MTQNEVSNIIGHLDYKNKQTSIYMLDVFELLHHAQIPTNVDLFIKLRNYMQFMSDFLNSTYKTNTVNCFWLGASINSMCLYQGRDNNLKSIIGIELRNEVIVTRSGCEGVPVDCEYEEVLGWINSAVNRFLRENHYINQAPFRPDDYTINGVKQ